MESLSSDQPFRADLIVRNAILVDVIAHVLDATEGTAPLLREAAAAGRWLVPTLDMFAQTVTRDPAYIDPIHASLNLFREEGGRLLCKLATVTDLATVRTTVRAGQVTWTRATTSTAERRTE